MTLPDERRYNARLGMVLFSIYLALYLGFVLINAFAAAWMEWRPWGGLNLAILYGFGLIVVALVLAMIYGLGCRREGSSAGLRASRERGRVADGGSPAQETQR